MGIASDHMVRYGQLMDLYSDYPARVAAVIQARMDATATTKMGLEKLSGISRMTIGRKLTGTPPGFTITELARIAPHLGMTVSEIHIAAERDAA